MFSHVLLPTNGSELCEAAIRKGVQLAKESNARVTGVCVVPKFHVLAFNAEMLEDTKDRRLIDGRAHAERHLSILQRQAAEEGVPCDTVVEVDDHAFEAIIRTAEAKGCDLIVMASHGRRGVKGLLLGSETQKVLTHTHIPVLVFR